MSGFAWAKEPMFERLDALSPAVPLTAVYGGESWVSTISREDFVDKTNRADLPDSYTDVRVIIVTSLSLTLSLSLSLSLPLSMCTTLLPR